MLVESRDLDLEQGFAASGSSTISKSTFGKDLAMDGCALRVAFEYRKCLSCREK